MFVYQQFKGAVNTKAHLSLDGKIPLCGADPENVKYVQRPGKDPDSICAGCYMIQHGPQDPNEVLHEREYDHDHHN